MADSDFGLDPFSTGDPSAGGFLQPVTEENVGEFDPAIGVPSGSTAISLSLPSSSNTNFLTGLLGFGRTLTNDIFSYSLQSQQISKGQAPSIATDGSGRPSGQLQQLTTALKAGTTGTSFLVIGAVVLVFILLVAGRRH